MTAVLDSSHQIRIGDSLNSLNIMVNHLNLSLEANKEISDQVRHILTIQVTACNKINMAKEEETAEIVAQTALKVGMAVVDTAMVAAVTVVTMNTDTVVEDMVVVVVAINIRS